MSDQELMDNRPPNYVASIQVSLSDVHKVEGLIAHFSCFFDISFRLFCTDDKNVQNVPANSYSSDQCNAVVSVIRRLIVRRMKFDHILNGRPDIGR